VRRVLGYVGLCACIGLVGLFFLPGLAGAGVTDRLQRLASAYGLEIKGEGAAAQLALPNGGLIPWSSETRLPGHPWSVADLQGLFMHVYPMTNVRYGIQNTNADPGRRRNYQLLKAVYGASPEAVRRALVPVNFCGTMVLFSGKNGAAQALSRVSQEICKSPRLLAWMQRLIRRDRAAIGTWCWRMIAGTANLSPHSFGIAIDILDRAAPTYTYWRYTSPNERRASLWPLCLTHAQIWQPPAGLVACFEKHGFIWGGKWYHFDPMHFEFRPEFFSTSRER
jgi:hypothetical protein